MRIWTVILSVGVVGSGGSGGSFGSTTCLATIVVLWGNERFVFLRIQYCLRVADVFQIPFQPAKFVIPYEATPASPNGELPPQVSPEAYPPSPCDASHVVAFRAVESPGHGYG